MGNDNHQYLIACHAIGRAVRKALEQNAPGALPELRRGLGKLTDQFYGCAEIVKKFVTQARPLLFVVDPNSRHVCLSSSD